MTVPLTTVTQSFFKFWNPDWEDDASLQGLAAFGRTWVNEVEPLTAMMPRSRKNFGRVLYELLDRCIRTGVADTRFFAILHHISPFVMPGSSIIADEFWNAIVTDARTLSAHRRRTARPRSLWGVTPINMLKECTQADRRCGVEAESLVFTTYYISSDFDRNLSKLQTQVLEQPELAVHRMKTLLAIYGVE